MTPYHESDGVTLYHSREYRERLKSRAWKQLRQQMIASANGCERCFLITDRLELHHKHYETLGREREQDLEVLCEACHKQADQQRAMQTARNSWYCRVAGWAAKKYGEDWESVATFDEAEQAFESWLESRAD